MAAKIIDGKKIATDIIKQLSSETKKFIVKPNIITIKIGDDPTSDLYLKLRDNACKKININSEHKVYSADVSEEQVLKAIKDFNQDKNIHGILIQFPIPSHISQKKLIDSISPIKDVEGLTPQNMGRILTGDEDIIPCTPLAVLNILKHEKTTLKGKNVLIINHSTLVGKPLSILMLNRNASVSVCHVYTEDLKSYTSKAEIIISAAGVPNLIRPEHVNRSSFIIDVGIIKTDSGVRGDVDFQQVKDLVNKITPVPGGVGPVTVACSLKNMVKTYKKNMDMI
jgi:methylenetetrahydrofolate dehydrogenase (NADP+)/methenyltetrahydrofolate cyclohydrolase